MLSLVMRSFIVFVWLRVKDKREREEVKKKCQLRFGISPQLVKAFTKA